MKTMNKKAYMAPAASLLTIDTQSIFEGSPNPEVPQVSDNPGDGVDSDQLTRGWNCELWMNWGKED